MQLIILERDSVTDKSSSDRSTVEVIFRRFVGQNGSKVTNNTSSKDSKPLREYKDSSAGARMDKERKVDSPPRIIYQTFTELTATDWLMDYCSTVGRKEASEFATHFIEQELIWYLVCVT